VVADEEKKELSERVVIALIETDSQCIEGLDLILSHGQPSLNHRFKSPRRL
jgi:hypothetical protein